MAYDHILTETRGRVGIIRFNRPEKLNALNDQMREETLEQIGIWNEDSGIGAIMLTGEGRAFCSGADLGHFAVREERNRGATAATFRTGPEPMSWTAGGGRGITPFLMTSKPTIAAVNGYSVGVGLTFILPFDVRIASTDALFSIRFIKVGLMPELGSTRLLAQLVGLGNAADMCPTGRMVPADEALRMGLVIKVTEPEDLLDAAVEKANEIANNPPQAVMFVKELLRNESAGSRYRPSWRARGHPRSDRAAPSRSRRGVGSVHGEAGTEVRAGITSVVGWPGSH